MNNNKTTIFKNKMGKLIMGAVVLTSLATQAHAGLFATTVHSRANCINNESITWWNGHPYDWRTISMHIMQDGNYHYVDSQWNYRDVSRAVHWGEGLSGGWRVRGFHYLKSYNMSVPFAETYAEGCNIIDGWFYD